MLQAGADLETMPLWLLTIRYKQYAWDGNLFEFISNKWTKLAIAIFNLKS